LVFQQAGEAADFQTPFALQPLSAGVHSRATQAEGLLPGWQRCSQVRYIAEQDARACWQPSCAVAAPTPVSRKSPEARRSGLMRMEDLPEARDATSEQQF
jgi:hypothetical protein